MFNFFKHRTVSDLFNDANKTYSVPPMPEVTLPASTCHYTVGTTTDGKTILRVGDGYYMSLTMNEAGTRQLIRILEATLPEGDEVKE